MLSMLSAHWSASASLLVQPSFRPAVQQQWPSLCVAPAAGDAALDLGAGHLVFMANVVGNDPDAPTGGEILIHATGEAEALNFTVSRSLLRACTLARILSKRSSFGATCRPRRSVAVGGGCVGGDSR